MVTEERKQIPAPGNRPSTTQQQHTLRNDCLQPEQRNSGEELLDNESETERKCEGVAVCMTKSV